MADPLNLIFRQWRAAQQRDLTRHIAALRRPRQAMTADQQQANDALRAAVHAGTSRSRNLNRRTTKED